MDVNPEFFHEAIRYFSCVAVIIIFLWFVLSRMKQTARQFFRENFWVVFLIGFIVALALALLFASVKGCEGEGEATNHSSAGKNRPRGGARSNMPLKIKIYRVSDDAGFIEIFEGVNAAKTIQLKVGWENLLEEQMASYTNQADARLELWSDDSVPRAVRSGVIDCVENMGFEVNEVNE